MTKKNRITAIHIADVISLVPEIEWEQIIIAFKDRVPTNGWLHVRNELQRLINVGAVKRIDDVHREVYLVIHTKLEQFKIKMREYNAITST